MTDHDFEATARCVKLYERLRQAVRTRQYTDRPGSEWRLTDFAELPEYFGTRNKVMISATEDGEKFEVLVFNLQGRQLHSKAYKTMDVAFRNGEKFADAEYPEPASAPRHIPIAPQPGDDIHATSHLSEGCGLVKGLPLSVLTESAPVVQDEQPATDLPQGTRVMTPKGRPGTVNGYDIGRVTDPDHDNYDRQYVGVDMDPVEGDMGAGRRGRFFVDELAIVPTLSAGDIVEAVTVGTKPMTIRVAIDREPWSHGVNSEGIDRTVLSDGRGVVTVRTDSMRAVDRSTLSGDELSDIERRGTVGVRGPKCGHGFALKPGVTSAVKCEFGHEYGVFGDEGPIDRADCAVQAANDAAFYMAEDDGDTEYVVKVVCPDHQEQPQESCEECLTDEGEPQGTDEALRSSFREVSTAPANSRPTYERFS